jgi:fibronectin type 3 domain-containing protein
LAFGSVNLSTSTEMTSTITNTGNSNVTITGVNTVGAGFSSTGVAGGLTLQPNQTVTLTVTFDPTAAGAVSGASVTIVSNAGGLVVPLSGSGNAAAQSVSLTWTASSSSDVVGYYAYRSTTSGSGYVKLDPTSPASTEQYTDSTVQSGTTYYYVVTAVDSNDVESDYSGQATAVIP